MKGPLDIDLTINLAEVSSIWSNTSVLLDRSQICQSAQGLRAQCRLARQLRLAPPSTSCEVKEANSANVRYIPLHIGFIPTFASCLPKQAQAIRARGAAFSPGHWVFDLENTLVFGRNSWCRFHI